VSLASTELEEVPQLSRYWECEECEISDGQGTPLRVLIAGEESGVPLEVLLESCQSISC